MDTFKHYHECESCGSPGAYYLYGRVLCEGCVERFKRVAEGREE